MAERKSLAKIKDETEFFQHQIDGVRWGAKHPSFILADEMGLGKTLTAVTVGAVDFERGQANKILAVAPAHLRWNWLEDIERHTNYRAMVLHGTPLYRQNVLATFRESDWDVLIASYETVVNDYEWINAVGWDIVVCDEAHYLKNKKSKRSREVRKIRRRRGFALTGSPMLNRPDELWALLNFCDPARFNNYWQFVNRYCVMGGFKMKQIVGVKNKGELRGILEEYMLRRLKKDCLDLPDKQVITIKVEMHPDQKKIYETVENELRIEVPNDPNPMECENILTKMLRLKQITGTPAALTIDGLPSGLPDVSYKLDRVVEMCQEFTQDADDRSPVVVFTQFREVMKITAERLAAVGIPVWMLHGDVKQEDRQKFINSWSKTKDTDTPGVIMVMLQMGVGLNLVAANKAIFIDSLYVPKLNEQAEDRIHRIGASTTQPVQIYYMVSRGTVEEHIERILKAKRKLFNSLIEDQDPQWRAKLIQELQKQPQPIAGTV